MALALVDYEQQAREAVKAFWGNRQAARLKQIAAGKADQGERSGVTAGKNMDGFLALIHDLIQANGLAQAEILQQRTMLTLPGYFRPTKLWDLLSAAGPGATLYRRHPDCRGTACRGLGGLCATVADDGAEGICHGLGGSCRGECGTVG